jgi:radical SAM-linked protein
MAMPDPDMTTHQPTESTRHQITFATQKTLAYISVLESSTIWERTLRRAHIPLKYSQGYNPRPRMHFAAPLPVGCGSEAELLDIALDTPMDAAAIHTAVMDVTPPDLSVVTVESVDDHAPSLSDRLLETTYRVWLKDVTGSRAQASVEAFLEADSIPLPKRGRRHRGKTYDLKPLVLTLNLDPGAPKPWVGLTMRLSARPGATGRPDEVVKALGLSEAPRRCTRTALILAPLDATNPNT